MEVKVNVTNFGNQEDKNKQWQQAIGCGWTAK